MPVTDRTSGGAALSQRVLYARGGITRWYWDLRDRAALSLLDGWERLVVDLGCGEGVTLEKLVRAYGSERVLGMDVLQENVAICRRHGLPARLGDAYATGLPAESADAVLLLEVLEHLERPADAVREIGRILRPEGRLIAIFPNDRAMWVARMLTLKFREARYDAGHVRQWSPRAAARLLAEQGFAPYYLASIPFGLWPISLHCVLGARKQGRRPV